MIIDMEEGFICKNCQYKQHQCFACGLLGSSDDTSSQPEVREYIVKGGSFYFKSVFIWVWSCFVQTFKLDLLLKRWNRREKIPFPRSYSLLISCIACQVFQCSHDNCAHFYHPKCIAQLLYPNSEEATHFEVEVAAAREKFTCPMHECMVCKGAENKNDRSMQFAVCRRCPTVYHRKCLPRFVFLDNGHVLILCSFMFYLKMGPFFPEILLLLFLQWYHFQIEERSQWFAAKGVGRYSSWPNFNILHVC